MPKYVITFTPRRPGRAVVTLSGARNQFRLKRDAEARVRDLRQSFPASAPRFGVARV